MTTLVLNNNSNNKNSNNDNDKDKNNDGGGIYGIDEDEEHFFNIEVVCLDEKNLNEDVKKYSKILNLFCSTHFVAYGLVW
jgi:hypothetical protein